MEIGTNSADFMMAAKRVLDCSTIATASPSAGGINAPNSVHTSVIRIDLRTWSSVRASVKLARPTHSRVWPSRLASVKLRRRAITVGSTTMAAKSAMGGPMKRTVQRVVGFNGTPPEPRAAPDHT